MRPAIAVTLALLLLVGGWPRRGAAQAGPQPNLVLTLAAGVADGTSLWTVPRQPFCPVYSGGSCAGPSDMLRLAREQSSSITIGAAVSYFPGRSVGIQAEMAYLGLPLRDACTVLHASPSQQSRQLCANMQGASHSTGAISFAASALVRAASRSQLSPYLRGGVGLVTFDHSPIELVGVDSAGPNSYQVYIDDSPQRIALSFVAGAGFTLALGPAYRFRLEARDAITRFQRVTGPSDASLVPPPGAKFFHHFVLTMGPDVVLEQRGERRSCPGAPPPSPAAPPGATGGDPGVSSSGAVAVFPTASWTRCRRSGASRH